MMDTTVVRKRRRSWSEALKREIVTAASAPGASVSMVARRYDVNTNQVFAWRKRFATGASTAPATAMPAPHFLPVTLTAEQPSAEPAPHDTDMIEIEHPRGYRVRFSGTIKAATLRLILDALDRR